MILAKENVLQLDENGYLSKNVKIETIAQTDAFVRFVIRGGNGSDF